MRESDPTVSFEDVEVKAETDLGLLCVFGGKEHWIPKSQIHDNSEVYEKGTEGTLIVSEWFAKTAKIV